MKQLAGGRKDADSKYLDGQLLVAMPGMSDPRFARAVIYMCAHSEDGAMGLVLNHPAATMNFPDLLVQLEIIGAEQAIRLPRSAGAVPVLMGGPVETGRGFVLHSDDYHVEHSTLEIDSGVSLTATLDILRAIAHGDGPARALLALGYAGWSPGQLEEELQANGWLVCPADSALVFDASPESKYDRALRSIGVDPAMLVSDAGHA